MWKYGANLAWQAVCKTFSNVQVRSNKKPRISFELLLRKSWRSLDGLWHLKLHRSAASPTLLFSWSRSPFAIFILHNTWVESPSSP